MAVFPATYDAHSWACFRVKSEIQCWELFRCQR